MTAAISTEHGVCVTMLAIYLAVCVGFDTDKIKVNTGDYMT